MGNASQVVESLSGWMKPHLHHVAVAMVATFMALYGGKIGRWVKNSVKKHNFFLRFGAFVLLCAFGFGALSALATALVERGLTSMDRQWLSPLVVGVFLTLALLAEEEKNI